MAGRPVPYRYIGETGDAAAGGECGGVGGEARRYAGGHDRNGDHAGSDIVRLGGDDLRGLKKVLTGNVVPVKVARACLPVELPPVIDPADNTPAGFLSIR